jgi:hypothetical protein
MERTLMSRYLIIYGDGTDHFQRELVDGRDLGSEFSAPEAFISAYEERRKWSRYKGWDYPPRFSYHQVPREVCWCTVYREALSGDFELFGYVGCDLEDEGAIDLQKLEP